MLFNTVLTRADPRHMRVRGDLRRIQIVQLVSFNRLRIVDGSLQRSWLVR